MKAPDSPTADISPVAEGTQSLARSALSGVAWNWGASAVLVLTQIVSTVATARLVSPREFGLYATGVAVAGFAGYFTMTAVGPGLQRRSELGERTAGTALALSLAGSLLVALALWLSASLWARAWGVPEAAWVVRVMAITLLLTSTATVPIALIRRRLQFRKAAIVETSSLVLGMAGGVVLATQLHSALALALGQAAGAAALFVASAAIVRHQLRLSFDRADARELFVFASQVGGLGFFTYVAITVPSWFVARVFGPFVLGLYSRGYLIVALPADYAATSIFKVIYPLYGRVRNDLARTKVLLDEGLTLTTGFVWPLFALIAGAAPVIITLLLGPRWDAAAPLLALFALAACGNVPSWLLTNAAEAFGWMRVIAARQLAFLIGVVTTLLVAYVADLSLNWLLVGIAASQWMAYALTLRPFILRQFLDTGRVMRVQAVHGAVALIAFAAAAACAQILDGAALLVQVGGQVAVGAAVLGTILHGRSWIPATQVLARRIGAEPGQSLVRSGLGALR